MAEPGAPLTIVICVDHASVTGGQAKVAFDSASGLKAAGHRPIVFAAAGPVAPELVASGVEIVCLDQTDLVGNPSPVKAALQGIWNLPAERALGDLLASLPSTSTIVHVHGWAKALSPSIARPIAKSGLPALYTIHEYFLFCPNGGFYNYQAHEVCHLTPLSPACWATHCDSRTYARKLWRNVRLTLAHRVAGLRDVFSDFICISALQREIVRPHLPALARVHAVSNPIAAENLGPKPDPAAGDFIFVGRISPEKGPKVFAEAARLAGIIPVFVGDGPAADELRTLYPEAKILGWQEPEAARAAMRKARALVFPSLWYEGQPLTVLEAKSMGTPVIVSDVCAGREEIADGVTGAWFKSADASDLARVLNALRDDALVTRMSHAAHADFWRDPPTLTAHVERITAIYRELTARAPARLPSASARPSRPPADAHSIGSPSRPSENRP
jgi:glycosyltransferase involved in cell wall biosynthesis